MANTRKPAKNLTCLFKDIADKYPERRLAPCKTDSRIWKHASSHSAVERTIELAKYFPELSPLINSLEDFSLCEKHYNQIVATDYFCENFFNLETLSMKKKQKTSTR